CSNSLNGYCFLKFYTVALLSLTHSFFSQPALLKAIFNVDPDEVRSLIFKKEDVNAQDNEKRTPLHAAAYLGDAEIIELLILSGARVNAKDNKWLTPLHRSVASCSEEAVQVLLKHSADVNARDKNWQTPLHIAAANKAVRCAEALVPLLSNVNVSDRAGRTALHHAAFSGHLEMVRLLLSRGANINAFDKKDRRAIHWAAYMGHIEVVKLLASHGAEVACKDKKSYTPLHAAASSGMISVVKYLLDLGVDINEPNAYGNTPLHVACYNGQDVVVNELIECGANVNQVNEKGFAPLHFTAASRHGALCLELLVCNGADVNIKASKHQNISPYCQSNFICSATLIQVGAEIDCEDKNGNTPLHIAARYGHELLINTLITNRADTAKRGVHGMFPLHLAALSGFSDCCRKLLSSGEQIFIHRSCIFLIVLILQFKLGSDFRLQDHVCFSRTPLHYAAANCNYQCLFALVGSGASVNDLDERGCTPLHYAAASDTDGKCLEYLLRNDANPGIRDNQGYNAVHYASAYGHRLCLELIASETPLDVLMETSGTDILNDSDIRAPVSPLHLAAYHGHHHAMEVLVQSLLDLDVRNSQGRTPLDLAAFKGHVECVDVLINQGASILVKDFTLKRTPIHAAAACGHTGVLGGLLHAAQSVETLPVLTDNQGYTPLHWACYNGTEMMLQRKQPIWFWERVALHDSNAVCLFFMHLLNASVMIHVWRFCWNKRFFTRPKAILSPPSTVLCKILRRPLFRSVCVRKKPLTDINEWLFSIFCRIHDNEGAAEMLIDTLGPAIVNGKDSKNRTPLHAAAFTDHVECLQLLLSHNAQVNSVDTTGKTPLMMAAENGQTNAVELLVSSAKADLTLQDAVKNTALHLACSKGHETSALLILEKITDRNLINATNAALQTPLHVAARNGLTVVVQELLAKGASVLAVDENGYTPALACAPNKDVADCLALILATMMPVSPCTPAPALPFSAINHYTTSPSKSVTFDSLPALRDEHSSYCSFNNVSHHEGFYKDEELNDSDSETY
uniref:Ankyrin repeat domain 28 n=1 Tax=Scophthalmus maximus TaxID=52904 RepID=A0A8D3DEI7_SCOMX